MELSYIESRLYQSARGQNQATQYFHYSLPQGANNESIPVVRKDNQSFVDRFLQLDWLQRRNSRLFIPNFTICVVTMVWHYFMYVYILYNNVRYH